MIFGIMHESGDFFRSPNFLKTVVDDGIIGIVALE